MIKNLMHLICSKSATTTRKRMATRQLYSWLLLSYLCTMFLKLVFSVLHRDQTMFLLAC
jgi:hypothetical protein